MRVFYRLFAFLAGLFWLATLAAIGWQIWHFFAAQAWETLTVKMALERLWGPAPLVASDSAQVAFAIVSSLSLVLFLGLCALASSALAKLVE
jgi:hypothetical protein